MMTIQEYRLAVARRFAERMRQGDFIAQAGGGSLAGLPCTVSEGKEKVLSHTNALVVMQVMKDRGLADPRFFTAAQIADAGWRLKDSANGLMLQGIQMQFQTFGAGELKRFKVYSAADIDGIGPWEKSIPGYSREELRGAVEAETKGIASDMTDSAVLDAWFKPLGDGGLAGQLERQLLGVWLETQGAEVSERLCPVLDEAEWSQISRWAGAEPQRLYTAIGKAEILYANLADKMKALRFEREPVVAPLSAPSAERSKQMSTDSYLEWVNRKYSERQAVLAVPFPQKDRANDLGAIYHPEHKLWFVPSDADLTLFKEWTLSGNSLGPTATTNIVKDSFADAMRAYGLRIPANGILADGRWHNVAVDKKKSNNAGAYLLVVAGVDTPYGKISNKDSGLFEPWIYEGELLTPEQRKRVIEQAKLREEAAKREERLLHDKTSVVAREVYAKALPGDGHGYGKKKGIAVDGLRQIAGAELLKYDAFYGENGKSVIRANQMYLLVPLQTEKGEIRNLQAISPDGKFKSFMRGAQKTGLMFVIGAKNFEEVVNAKFTHVAYCEGYATGYDFRRGIEVPTVVTFDAGNLETVVKRTAATLPKETMKLLAMDNDQFQIERALTYLAERVGVNPFTRSNDEVPLSNPVNIVSRYGASAQLEGERRAIGLGDVVVDGDWHQAPKGKYRVFSILEADGKAVASLSVEVVLAGGERNTQTFNNRGREAGKVGIAAAENVVLVGPSFASLEGRPSDWNDLMMAEGLAVVKEQILSQVEAAKFKGWFQEKVQTQGMGMDDDMAVIPSLGETREVGRR